MAVDEYLADRIRAVLAPEAGVSERRMFGSIAFMLRGHMCCGIAGGDFLVRVGPAWYQEALAEPHARPMDFTGRPLKSMVYVNPDGCRSDEALARWVGLGVAFVVRGDTAAEVAPTHAGKGRPQSSQVGRQPSELACSP